MKMSRASTYALYGLSYLAGQSTKRYIPIPEICGRFGVPQKHLAKILHSLVKAGLLRSSRGARGGFTLARPPAEITLLEVLEVFDGPLPDTDCLLFRDGCPHDAICAINKVWQDAQQHVAETFSGLTLADIADGSGATFKPPPARSGTTSRRKGGRPE